MYRWKATDGPIPIGINLSSFESRKQSSMVKRCLARVLSSLNAHNIGPQFRFVEDPSESAFFIFFGGDNPHCYASSFFPGSHPKDWYIYVYKQSLKLSTDQKRLLMDAGSAGIKTARLEALEQNLIKILAHEMLHIVGLRHCDVNLDVEQEPYVRFPPGLSDNDNWDPLMQGSIDRIDLSRLGWNSQTLEETRQIYAMAEGETVGRHSHRIRDVSWQDGAKVRKRMARINAQYSGSRQQNTE